MSEISEKLRAQLIRDEGYKPSVYQDSRGYFTIGVGHLCDARLGGKLPDSIIQDLLDYDIREATGALIQDQPWVAQLDPARQGVLIAMAFNLGLEPFDHDGIKDWPNFLAQVQRGDYEQAASNMLSTLWAQQVGSRATRLAQQLRTGEWT